MGTRINQIAVGNNIIQSADSVNFELRTLSTEMVREAIRGFCKTAKRVSNAQLYHVMGLTREPEKDRLRARVADMVRQGEVIKIEPGLYEYNSKFRLRTGNESFPKLWRFIRTQKPGWSITHASQLTRVSYTQAARYFGWLENGEYC